MLMALRVSNPWRFKSSRPHLNDTKGCRRPWYFFEESSRKLTAYSYYEKLGDSYEEMAHMPGDGDRLGLYKKTPDYEEVKGKETEN